MTRVCYTLSMYNWSVDEHELKKDPAAYARFELEQRANFGLAGKKLSASLLKKHWDELALDPARRRFLALLLYGTKSRGSH